MSCYVREEETKDKEMCNFGIIQPTYNNNNKHKPTQKTKVAT